MNTKKILGVVAVLALVAVAMVGAGAATPTGSGTQTDPYIVGTLEDLKTAFGNGGYVQLSADIDSTTQDELMIGRAESGKEVNLDLHGFIIGYTGTTHSSGLINVHKGSTLNVSSNNDPNNRGAIDGSNSSNHTYSAIKVTVKGDSLGSNATVVINSGNIIGFCAGINGHGERNGYSITVKGGTVKGVYTGPDTWSGETGSTGIYAPAVGTVTIEGGTVEGYSSAIEIRAGTLNVTGGTLKSLCETYSCTPNGNGFTTKGAVIAAAQHTTEQLSIVSVTGGKLIANGAGHQISLANPQDTTKDAINFTAGTTVEVYLNNDNEKLTKENVDVNLTATGNIEVNKTWDTFKDYLNDALKGAVINATDASKTVTVDIKSGANIDTSVEDSQMSTGGTTTVDASVGMKYYVYIPSKVTLGSSAVTAEYKVVVTNPEYATTATKDVNVYSGQDLTNGSTVKLMDGTTVVDSMKYTVEKGGTAVTTSMKIVQAPINTSTPATGTLTFGAIDTTGKQSGTYEDTLTFTVKVEAHTS